MRIKTEVELVTGFLGSGKTTFINSLLKNTLVRDEVVLILQCEAGEKNILLEQGIKNKVIVKEQEPTKVLSSAYLKQLIGFYNPHRIIVEHNGTRSLGEVLSLFNNELDELCLEPTVYHITDAVTFDMFYYNMREMIEPFIYHSNLIVINNVSMLQENVKKKLVKRLEALNQGAFILPLSSITELDRELKKADVLQDDLVKSFKITISNKFKGKIV